MKAGVIECVGKSRLFWIKWHRAAASFSGMGLPKGGTTIAQPFKLGMNVQGPTQSRRGRLTQSQRYLSSYWMRCFLMAGTIGYGSQSIPAVRGLFTHMMSALTGSWRSIALTLFALTVALFAHRSAYVAGYHVKPESATIYQIVKFWVLVMASVLIPVRWRQSATATQKSFRLCLAAVCLCPLLFSSFRENRAWNSFLTRMKQDIRPIDLARWFASAVETNTSGTTMAITRKEFSQFGKAGADYDMPKLYVTGEEKMLVWGSDLQTWAIVLSDQSDSGLRWDQNLFFRSMQK
jgi:hypothetical protein